MICVWIIYMLMYAYKYILYSICGILLLAQQLYYEKFFIT